MCKVSLLKARISILSRLLQCFLKVLQNRSEKLKNAFPKTRNAILLGVFNDFQTSHTIFTIKLQTFEVRDSELHFARQKQCFGAKLCARLLKKRSPSPKVVPNRSEKAKKIKKTKNIELYTVRPIWPASGTSLWRQPACVLSYIIRIFTADEKQSKKQKTKNCILYGQFGLPPGPPFGGTEHTF